ncbi:MAG: 3-carboxy-cis,cis-muconate cycloisomerase [Candidatus Electronema aureum]|uniref:3-carboxy-cis,cis-muconate cycloisomerase n=1 Tax=Candidatus Electronema aureum TaxID=2005002 RepID=A0A521G2U6_9BACT|nr:MAG: 3-carboxy-cis,cis-muconate cycloisomerase [Candidatus Electronema aureum]
MNTCTPNSHIVDSGFYSGGYTTTEARQVFCDLHRYQRWLDVESALAMAMAGLNIIPVAAAENIQQNAHINKLDLDAIRAGLKVTNHSLMPLLAGLRQVCDKEAGQFIHFGATTQDIQDTAQVLELRDIIEIVERELHCIIKLLIERTQQYQDLVTIGRTHCQHALPMTMGLKMAGWLDEVWRNVERLHEMKQRVLVSQLFGGVGTMDAFGEHALPLLTEFSVRLGLQAPNVAWHASRDRFAEYLSVFALTAGSLARIADEIRCLARNETGEMEEPFHMGKIGSSTMPHKRNPELCEQVVVLSKLIKAQAMLGYDGLLCEHERDYRSVRLEWAALTDSSLYMCGLLAMMKHIVADMTVHEERVRENVLRAAPLISSEALMFFIGTKIGKENAHALVYQVSMEAVASNRTVLDILMQMPEVAKNFKREEIEQAILPEKHIGMAKELSQRTIAAVQAKMQAIGDELPQKSGQLCPLMITGNVCPLKKQGIR